MKPIFRKKSLELLRDEADNSELKKSLTVFDLTMLGIGAIIGTGIFVLTGEAAAGTEHALGAGPALSVSFIITGFTCLMAALCYAEFASMIPVSGSAYTYAYNAFGEIIAWIIGWDLILEYAVGNVAVAIGWSGYLKSLLEGFGIYLPPELSAHTGAEMIQLQSGKWVEYTSAVASRTDLSQPNHIVTSYLNLPAVLIVVVVTILLYIGIKESARINALLVLIKLTLIGVFLFLGFRHFDPSVNWEPFAPNGMQGILTGAALVFFAYVGFDAVSTTAEESKNPQRDLPRAMIYSLIICTVLYILVTVILTGIAPLHVLGNEKPVAEALRFVGENGGAFIIALGVTITMPTVLLVMQLGQIRILYSMSRDHLIGTGFSKIHRKFKTPDFATILVGLVVAVLAGTIDIGIAAELTNIGTLFAFIIVAAGIWLLRRQKPDLPRKFRVPAVGVVASLCIITCLMLMIALPMVTWIRFVLWMGIGLFIYLIYGYRKSALVSKTS